MDSENSLCKDPEAAHAAWIVGTTNDVDESTLKLAAIRYANCAKTGPLECTGTSNEPWTEPESVWVPHSSLKEWDLL
eukprot:5470372-Pleurochrysis_carterae.AAC.4